jgi:transcriptional regulator GlxA family with amidase domain
VPAAGFLVFPGVEELDLVGPWELLATWSRHLNGPSPCLLVAQSLAPVTCANGLTLQPQVTFDQVPELDLLLVPGGPGTRSEVDNEILIEFIRTQAPRCRALLSVCTGSFLLHRAGLLTGRRATTHWASLDRLREAGGVEVVEQRWVRDGDIWSSAGVSAGMDMALSYIAASAGDDIAGKVQLGAEFYPDGRRYGTAAAHPKAPAYLRDGGGQG